MVAYAIQSLLTKDVSGLDPDATRWLRARDISVSGLFVQSYSYSYSATPLHQIALFEVLTCFDYMMKESIYGV